MTSTDSSPQPFPHLGITESLTETLFALLYEGLPFAQAHPETFQTLEAALCESLHAVGAWESVYTEIVARKDELIRLYGRDVLDREPFLSPEMRAISKIALVVAG